VDKVCIFIDGSNFYHALAENNKPKNIDFDKLAAALTGPNRKHVQTYYYNTPLLNPDPRDRDCKIKEERRRDQQRFFNALRFVPNLTFRKGRFQKLPNSGQVEKGIDVMIAVDMLVLAQKNSYDTAILISSDADYKSAIEAVKFDFGKTVELHQVVGSKAYDLITVCSSYHPITDTILTSCLRVQRKK
jgi:uncharacterized LabA/DUF88 family protein